MQGHIIIRSTERRCTLIVIWKLLNSFRIPHIPVPSGAEITDCFGVCTGDTENQITHDVNEGRSPILEIGDWREIAIYKVVLDFFD
jgi:hypothetical protein